MISIEPMEKERRMEIEYIVEIYTGIVNERLIRCKDCKYFTRDSITGVTIPGTEYCILTMNNCIEENDYCSRAERKKE